MSTQPRRGLSIEQVQRWVMSFLIMAVSAFPLGALAAVISTIVDDGRRDDGVILLFVMGALGILAAGAIRIVHRRSVFTPWLLVGVAPAVITAIIVL